MHSYGCPLAKIEFHAVDTTNMIYHDGLFDLVVSFNAMEHIPDPEAALRKMIRVTRPGGLIYITFDPMWTSDSGSHFYHESRSLGSICCPAQMPSAMNYARPEAATMRLRNSVMR